MTDDQDSHPDRPAQQRAAGVDTPDNLHVQHPQTLPGDNRNKDGRGLAGEADDAIPTPRHDETHPSDAGPVPGRPTDRKDR